MISKIQFLSSTSHISSAQPPLVASGHCILDSADTGHSNINALHCMGSTVLDHSFSFLSQALSFESCAISLCHALPKPFDSHPRVTQSSSAFTQMILPTCWHFNSLTSSPPRSYHLLYLSPTPMVTAQTLSLPTIFQSSFHNISLKHSVFQQPRLIFHLILLFPVPYAVQIPWFIIMFIP